MATVMEAPGQVCHELNSSCKGSPLLVVILHELNRECPVSQAHSNTFSEFKAALLVAHDHMNVFPIRRKTLCTYAPV